MANKNVQKGQAVLHPVCFGLRTEVVEHFITNLYGLTFPSEWIAPIKGLQAEKTGRSPDKVNVPIASLNRTLATFLPHLASLPNWRYKAYSKDQPGDDATPPVWLLSRQPVEIAKLWRVIRAWLKVQFKSCPSYLSISERILQADLGGWQKLPDNLFDPSRTQHPNGTANLTSLAYTALPVLLADELIKKNLKIKVGGQSHSLVRVPVSRGAELMSWPPAKLAEDYFSYTIRITAQTLVGLAEPVVHFHYGVRRWESRPLVKEDNSFYSRNGRTVYLYRTSPWLEIPEVDVFTTTRLVAGYPPQSQSTAATTDSVPTLDNTSSTNDASQKRHREALWDNQLPEIAQALGVSIPKPHDVVREPLSWLPPDPRDGVVVALPVKDKYHSVGKGLSLDEHRSLTEAILPKLSHFLVERPEPVRLASRKIDKEWKQGWELREFPVEQRRQGLRQTIGDQITIEVWWQTTRFRDMMADRIESWLFGARPAKEETPVPAPAESPATQSLISEQVEDAEAYAEAVIADSERDLLDLTEDDDASSDSDQEAYSQSTLVADQEKMIPNPAKRPRKRQVEPPPTPFIEPKEISLGVSGARLRIVPCHQDTQFARFEVEGEQPKKPAERGKFRREESKKRVKQIKDQVEQAKEPTLAIVEMPNFRAPGSSLQDRLGDPKLAVRRGFALTGRLTKFVDAQAVAKPKYIGGKEPNEAQIEQALRVRCNGTIRDGLRLLGFLPAPLTFQLGSEFQLSPNSYIAGLWFIRLTSRRTLYKPLNLPVMVLVPASADRRVLFWMSDGKGLRPYYRGLLDLTELDENNALSLRDRAGQAKAFKQLTDFLRFEVARPANGLEDLVVLTVAQNIRQFWPGFNNAQVLNDRLVIKETQAVPEMSVGLSDLLYKLRIIRLRTNLSDETPEWYTDLATQSGQGYTQGVWQLPGLERTFYNLAGKPMTQKARREGKQSHPDENYALPSILEVNTVGLQPGDNPQMWARAVDQWRRMTYTCTDMTLFPLPLHWAHKLGRYAEAGGAWVFPDDWEDIDTDQPDDFDADPDDSDDQDDSEAN